MRLKYADNENTGMICYAFTRGILDMTRNIKRFSAQMIFYVILVFLVVPNSLLNAQDSPENSPDEPVVPSIAETQETATVTTLLAIQSSMRDLQNQIRKMETEIKSAQTEEQKAKAAKEINRLSDQLEAFQKDFEKIATGTDLTSLETKPKTEVDWQEELKILLGPILQELKNMTAKPRQIEQLNRDLSYYKDKLPSIRKAIDNLKALIQETRNEVVLEKLKNLQNKWENKEQQVLNQITVTNYQLQELTKDKKSMLESAQTILKMFFKSRGRNLLIAIIAFAAIFFLLRLSYQLLNRYTSFQQKVKQSIAFRLSNIAYQVLTVLGAVLALLMAVYISGDWVLLSLFVIFLVGLAWAAKETIPRYWVQIKLLLNLGVVKEDERLMYLGVPWRVATLNFFTTLENPAFSIDKVRLPVHDLLEMRSRPYAEDEPWFPSGPKDWVLLDNGTLGQVLSQTHEFVQLKLLGGSIKTYQTQEYLRLNPENLSNDFRIRFTFSIDHVHRSESTYKIPEKMKIILYEKMRAAGFEQDFIDFTVEYKSAELSSIDFDIIGHFPGDIASEYERLTRLMHRICMEACIENGWTIPFTQVMLHEAHVLQHNNGEKEEHKG